MTNSLAFRIVVRVLRYVPGLLIALVIFSVGMGVRDFFSQATNQLVSVNGVLAGDR